jgi:hypothetical protein
MTPLEALAQIAQSVALNPSSNTYSLACVARFALQDSGEHGLLYAIPERDLVTTYCYCGWEWISKAGLVPPEILIAEHVASLAVAP